MATAALMAAEADAAAPGGELTFRPEWRPTPRVRSTASQEAKQAFSPSPVKEHVSGSTVPPRPQFQEGAVAELLKRNHAPVPFGAGLNGTYSIHLSYANILVLAVQDVTGFLRPPADKVLGGYLPGDARSSVVGKDETGEDNERWLISATKNGYTFKNVGTGLYLGMSTAPERGQYRILQAVLDPYYWWVNPSSKQPDQGPSVYQIHDTANLRYTLHAAVETLDSITSPDISFTPIIAHDNSEAPCQMWSFDN